MSDHNSTPRRLRLRRFTPKQLDDFQRARATRPEPKFDQEDVRRVKRAMIAIPPVCHAFWTPADWAKVTVVVEEPDTITGSSGTWDWTGEYDERELKLYRLRKESHDR